MALENLWNSIRVIDASAEVTEVRAAPATPLKWLAGQLQNSDNTVSLSDKAVDEVMSAAALLDAEPSRDGEISVASIQWPEVRTAIASLKVKIDKGPGFAVLHGLPIESMPDRIAVEIYRLMGREIAPLVAQKWNGEMIYSVRNTGEKYGYGVRGSRTSVELVFHVDNAFGLSVPDYVGLLCKQPAKSGGISRFCSLYTVHELLERQYPQALTRLYQPMLFDRQKEHAVSAPPVLLAPFFSWRGDKLFARANTSLVRKGYDVAGVQMDTALADALEAVSTVCESKDLWYEAPLERGHIQYLNNHEIAHYRSEFEDFDEPEKKRHLYRLWHRESGCAGYDGNQLSVD